MQSIIVYRNPLEAAMWNGMMSGSWVLLMIVLVLAAGSFVLTHAVLGGTKGWGRTRSGLSHSTINKIACVVAILVLVLAHFANVKGWV